MNKLILLIGIFLINNFVFGQWLDLGLQGTQVQMIENTIGYKYKNISGPTPATGITYEIKSTQSDWQSETTISTGGGGDYGCCSISTMYFMNVSTGIRCKGYQGIYNFQKTNDNGLNWSAFSGTINFSPKNMILVNDTTGYLSGNSYGTNHGQLYKLTPSAAIQLFDWDTLLFTNSNIEFTNSNTGFIIMNDINQNSHLFKTNDSGENWNKVFSDTITNFTSLSFPDSLTGYICSASGEIYKTIDGGINWVEVISPATNKINSVDFINDTVGYIACDVGEIYRTTDGALSWNNEPVGTMSNIIDVQMVDIHTAYCIDEAGILLKNSNVLSIELLSDNYISSVMIYPNPSLGFILISLPNNLNVNNVEFYDTNGKNVLRADHNSIDVSSLESGIYLIKIISGDKCFTSKFIKS